MAELSTFTPTNAPGVEPIRQRPQNNIYTALTGAAFVAALLGLVVIILRANAVLGRLW